jgi:hypothetical protein
MDANASGKTKKDWPAFAKRDWLTFGRADYLVTKVFLGIAVVGSVLFELVGPMVDAATNAPLSVYYTTKVTRGIELPRGATIDGNATVELLLKDATPGERLGQALPGLLLAALTIGVACLLFQLLRSTQGGEPFTRPNVRRVNTIALIIGIGGLLVQLAQGFADTAIHTAGRLPNPSNLILEMSFTPLPLVIMFVIALIGEAFRRGVQLREDVEGLV